MGQESGLASTTYVPVPDLWALGANAHLLSGVADNWGLLAATSETAGRHLAIAIARAVAADIPDHSAANVVHEAVRTRWGQAELRLLVHELDSVDALSDSLRDVLITVAHTADNLRVASLLGDAVQVCLTELAGTMNDADRNLEARLPQAAYYRRGSDGALEFPVPTDAVLVAVDAMILGAVREFNGLISAIEEATAILGRLLGSDDPSTFDWQTWAGLSRAFGPVPDDGQAATAIARSPATLGVSLTAIQQLGDAAQEARDDVTNAWAAVRNDRSIRSALAGVSSYLERVAGHLHVSIPERLSDVYGGSYRNQRMADLLSRYPLQGTPPWTDLVTALLSAYGAVHDAAETVFTRRLRPRLSEQVDGINKVARILRKDLANAERLLDR